MTDEKEDVDMETCINNNDSANVSGPATSSTTGSGNTGSSKGRKGDAPVKRDPDGGGNIVEGESDVKLPLHAIATHPVSCMYVLLYQVDFKNLLI